MTQQSAFPQKAAEQFARLFNVIFNSAILYGSTHPTTIKGIAPFLDLLSKALPQVKALSLVVDRESLFVEEWLVDKVINPRRILQQFEKSGIVSITFEDGVSHADIELLTRYTGDSNLVTPVDRIKQIFQQARCTRIKLNYVRYGKITDDQAVVGRDEVQPVRNAAQTQSSQQFIPPAQHAGTPASMQQIEEVLSLAQLFEHPQKSAEAFSKTALNPANTDAAVKSLAGLRDVIHAENAPSIDLLLNAVYELKMDLQESIAVQEATGKLLAVTAPLGNEMDNLTCDVIIKLVKEEFGEGGVPIRRLAEIIRRMLPDTNELKRLLPQLKSALLEAGMTLADYLQLIRALNFEFDSEALAHTLADAAGGVGASVEELVNAIRSQPDDAARLLVMASEIRKGVRDDDAQLSTMLTDYIEKVSTGLALDSRELGAEGGNKALKQMLEQLERQLLDNLKKYGIEEPVIARIGTLLSQRLDGVCDSATAKWISAEIDAKPHLSAQELSEQLVRMVGEQAQLDRLHDPVMAALTARGFDKEQMESMLKKLAGRISAGKMFKLPPGILSPNNMQFLLDREIKQHYRYKTPFATMVLTVEALHSHQGARRLTGEETGMILPKLFSVTKHCLRDIDLVGIISAYGEETIFALLAMTNEAGAAIARQRIQNKLATLTLKLSDIEFTLIVAMSLCAPPADEQKCDTKTYIEITRHRHGEAVREIVTRNGL